MENNRMIRRLVHEAIRMYGEAIGGLTREERAGARKDFERWFHVVFKLGMPGIRMNFGGCIICDDRRPGRFRRVLVVEPEVLAATGLRPLFASACDVCEDAWPAEREVLVKAALRRVAEEPPIPKHAIAG